MQSKVFGIDPAPPGKFPAKKALVDSDLDGIFSAAMLLQVYPNLEIATGDASGMGKSLYQNFIDANTIIVDLKYVEGCGLYFDHHESNRPQNSNFPGQWREVDSAARVVYEYFKDYADLAKFAAPLVEVDKFDSGNISLQEFLNPSKLIKFALSVERDDKQLNLLFIELLARLSLEEFFEHHIVASRIKEIEANRKQVFEFIKSRAEVKDNFVFVDATNFTGEGKLSGYLITSQFPECAAVVVYKSDKALGKTKVRFYGNDFNKSVKDYDLLSVAKKIASDAGGHRKACGFLLPEGMLQEDINKRFLELINS